MQNGHISQHAAEERPDQLIADTTATKSGR
jgi:hypothetical protein